MTAPADGWDADETWVVALAGLARAVASTLAGCDPPDDLPARFTRLVADPLTRAADAARARSGLNPASQMAWAWFQTGDALAQWSDLGHEVGRIADRHEEIEGLVAFLRDPPRDVPQPHRRHLAEAAATLTRLADRVTPEAVDLGREVTRFRAMVQRLPEDFRPLSVRDGLRAVRAVAEVRTDVYHKTGVPAELPAEFAAGVRVAALLLHAADAAGRRLDDAGWERVQTAAAQAARPATLEFDRTGEGTGAKVTDDATGFTVVQTGMTARDGSGAVWARPAVIRRPRRASPLRVALGALTDDPGPLAGIAREVLATLPLTDVPAAWWEGLSAERKGDWWWLVQQAAARPNDPPAAAVLQALQEAGVRPTPAAAAADPPGPWFVTAAPPGTPPAGPAVAVAFPDGTQVGPAVWLRLNPTRPGARTMVRGLDGCRPLLHRLRAADPDWPGWSEYNDAVWAIAVGRPGDPSADADAGLRAFRAVLRRVEETRDRPPPLADAYLDLGRRLHAVLTRDMGVALPLRLGDDLRPAPLTGPPTDGSEVEWVGGPERAGTVLAFELPDGHAAARLKVAVGPGNDDLLPWLNLPAPGPAALAEFARVLRAAPWDPRPATRLADGLAEVGAWAAGDTASARDWWATAPPNDPWWRELVRSEVVRSYPTVDAAGAVEWPTDAAPPAATHWEFSAEVPVRRMIAGARFGPTADRAGGRFSLGPRDGAASTLVAAEQLRAADPDNDVAARVWDDEVAAALGHPRPAALDAVADRLPTAPPAVVEAAREWFAAHGYVLVVPDPSDAASEYDANARKGAARVLRYGYDGPTSRLGSAVRSAGPPPPGYPELRGELKRLGESELVAALNEWPAADGDDDLETLAQAFYEAFYDRCGGEPVPAGWERATERLAGLMLERFGWRQYWVAHRHERDDRQVEYDPQVGRGNNTVRRTLRPGLETAAGVRKVSTKVTFGGDT